MDWNKEALNKIDFENISNVEDKKRIAQKVVEKVKNGQVVRIWIWINIIFGCNSNSKKIKRRKIEYHSYSYFYRNENALWKFRNFHNNTK